MIEQETNVENGKSEIDAKSGILHESENNDRVHRKAQNVNDYIKLWLNIYERKQNGKVDSFNEDNLREIVNSIESDNDIVDKYAFIYAFIDNSIKNGNLSVKTITNSINNDYNFLSLDIVRRLVEERLISINDLDFENIGDVDVKREIINLLTNNYQNPQPELPKEELNIDINSISTQIYFWGLPSSGKTCVLGSLMSYLQSGIVNQNVQSCNPDATSPGYKYMHGNNGDDSGIVGIFTPRQNKRTILLPGSTPPQRAYNTNYTLRIHGDDGKDKDYPVTIIDFAGEILNKIYDIVTRSDENGNKKEDLKKQLPFLFENKKGKHQMHFFLIDYCNDNNSKQNNVLLQTAQFIKEEKLFANNTKRISIIVTKIDKTGWCTLDDQRAAASELFDRKRVGYSNFKGVLDAICEDFQIEEVDVIPYSVGKLYFQRICVPDTAYPKELFDKIYKYGLCPNPSGIWSRIKKRILSK